MLYIVCNRYFLSDRILDPLCTREGIRILHAEPSHHDGSALWKWLVMAEAITPFRIISRRYYPSSYYNKLSQIGPQDRVLLFDTWSMPDFLCTVKSLPTSQVRLWLWNPIAMMGHSELRRKLFAHLMRHYTCEVSTFDRKDAAEYGFRFREQVYYRPEASKQGSTLEETNDTTTKKQTPLLFFVGQDKGRLPALMALARTATKSGFATDFHILPDRSGRNYSSEEQGMLTDVRLDYDETLNRIRRSYALVELLQKGQHGCTVRALEALFFRKKLITDNPTVTEEAFYHPDNIYLIRPDGTEKEERSLATFLQIPFHPIPEEILQRYDITHWIDHFL